MKKIALILLVLTGLTACKKEKGDIKETVEEKITDLSYGDDPMQKMDVYLPAYRSASTPLVLLLHGGAWVDGNKEDVQFIQNSLLQNGIACVNINYRYASANHHFDGMMIDVAAALSFIRSKADEWVVRKKDMVLLGVSAGAHISLLYTYAYKQPSEISAVISLAGPTSFSSEFLGYASATSLKMAIEYMAGASMTTIPLDNRYVQASPLARVSNTPTLLIHGKTDIVVPYEQSVLLQAELARQEIPNKLVPVEGAGHDLGVSNPVTADRILKEVVAWINSYSKEQ